MRLQTIEHLLKRRSVFIASKSFAESKLTTMDANEPGKAEYQKQWQQCHNEIASLDECISWLKKLLA